MKDLILIAVVVVLILASFLVVNLIKEEGDYVVVRIDGIEVARYDLSKDDEYTLNGGTNVLRIEGGKAYLVSATCPDHLCVKQGKIDQSGETITCLPNRLTVTVYGKGKGDVELIG